MSRQYAIKDRDGTIHEEQSRGDALRSQKAYGGMVVARSEGRSWKPYSRHKVFLWIFLVVQVGFIIWLISVGASSTNPTAAEIASWCGNGKWTQAYNSYQACVADAGSSLKAANEVGQGIGLGLIAIIWVIVDFLLAVTYGIYRLARR